MELEHLKSLWQENDGKLEQSISFNLRTLDFIQRQKVKSALRPLIWQRSIELTFHTAAIILLSIFCFHHYQQLPYAFSAYILIIFYAMTFRNCLAQLLTLSNINSKQTVTAIQSALAKIQLNSINYIRLSVLFIPALLCFPVVISKAIPAISDFDIIQQTHGTWWTAQLAASIILIPIGIWFYHQVNYKNADQKWVSNLIQKAAGTRVRNMMIYLKDLEKVKNDIKRS